MSAIGKRIKELRQLTGVSQVVFAHSLGVHQGHISKVETGVAVPSKQLIKSICRQWEVREEWLQKGKGSIEQKPSMDPKEIQEFESVLEKMPYEGLTRHLQIYNTVLTHVVESLQRFKAFNIQANHPRAVEVLKVKQIVENTVNKLQKELRFKLKDIKLGDLELGDLPLLSDLDKSTLNVLHVLDEYELKDIYLMLAIKGERLSKRGCDDLRSDIAALKKAAK